MDLSGGTTLLKNKLLSREPSGGRKIVCVLSRRFGPYIKKLRGLKSKTADGTSGSNYGLVVP